MVAIVRVGSFDHQDAIGRNSFRFSGRIGPDRKSTRLNSSHLVISYAVFCLKKKKALRTTVRCCRAYGARFPVGTRPLLRAGEASRIVLVAHALQVRLTLTVRLSDAMNAELR